MDNEEVKQEFWDNLQYEEYKKLTKQHPNVQMTTLWQWSCEYAQENFDVLYKLARRLQMPKYKVKGTLYRFYDGVIEAPDAETAYEMAKDDASLCDKEVGGDWSVDATLIEELRDE